MCRSSVCFPFISFFHPVFVCVCVVRLPDRNAMAFSATMLDDTWDAWAKAHCNQGCPFGSQRNGLLWRAVWYLVKMGLVPGCTFCACSVRLCGLCVCAVFQVPRRSRPITFLFQSVNRNYFPFGIIFIIHHRCSHHCSKSFSDQCVYFNVWMWVCVCVCRGSFGNALYGGPRCSTAECNFPRA